MALFLPMVTKVRDDPLGPQSLALLQQNLVFVQLLAGAEHKVDGEHNTIDVPRACVTLVWGGASYSISPASSDVTAVANPATGTITLTLAANRFDVNTLRAQINIKASGIESKPWMYGYEVVSATSVKVYLKQLSSSLGSGNSWAAADGSFDIALHSLPLARGGWQPGQEPKERGDTLTERTDDWNGLAVAHGQMELMRLVAHAGDGTHDVREVAKAWAHVGFKGPSGVDLILGSVLIDTVSRSGLGVYQINLDSAFTTPLQAFACPDYSRNNGGSPTPVGYVVHIKENSSTSVIGYIYLYDESGNVWNRADADFFVAIHGG